MTKQCLSGEVSRSPRSPDAVYLYGKKVHGIERRTLVIDDAGKLARERRGVKMPAHAQEVLDFVKKL